MIGVDTVAPGDMKRNGMHKMKRKQSFQVSNFRIGFFSRCVVLSLHSSSRNGMEQGRTSLLGVIRVMIEKMDGYRKYLSRL